MSETKFTKGEWFQSAGQLEHKRRVIYSAKSAIARTSLGRDHEEEVANARLIAASPKMFKALEIEFEWLESILNDYSNEIGPKFKQEIIFRRIDIKEALIDAG